MTVDNCGNCNGGHGCAGIDCCCPCHFNNDLNDNDDLDEQEETIVD